MLSKNKIKFINSIKKKKYRDIHQCFFVEGDKLVDELLDSGLDIIGVYSTLEWIQDNFNKVSSIERIDINEVTESELKKISALSTPNKVLAIVKQTNFTYSLEEIKKDLSIFLEDINDPGNLGTIIRTADWFGIKNIFCSNNSVDVFNPKVVQASMGAIYRTKVHYVDSIKFLHDASQLESFNIYGTFLEGNDIYAEKLTNRGLIVLGSESHGISKSLAPFINKKLFIPNYPKDTETSESLNISIAAAITCSEFRRRLN